MDRFSSIEGLRRHQLRCAARPRDLALFSHSAVSTLGELLGLGDVDPHELYAALDWLVERQAGIGQRLAERHLREHTLVLYDLTSSYVEGTGCPLAQRGHSRDGQKGTLQIAFGLLCTAEGCPVAVEVVEGSTADSLTVASQVAKIRERFGLQQVVLVGDRGMLTGARIREDLQGVDGLRWITTLRAPTIRKLVNAGTVTPSLFDERDLAEVTSEEFPGERVISVLRRPQQRRQGVDQACSVARRADTWSRVAIFSRTAEVKASTGATGEMPDPTRTRQSPAVLLHLREVMRRTAMARSTIHALVFSGNTPNPARVGTHALCWIDTWIAPRPRAGKERPNR